MLHALIAELHIHSLMHLEEFLSTKLSVVKGARGFLENTHIAAVRLILLSG